MGLGGAFLRERLTNIAVAPPTVSWVKIGPEKLESDATAQEVFSGAGLDAIIDASGGLLRDLVHLINRATLLCLRHRASRIDKAIAADAISEIRKEYEVGLNSKRVAELVHVRRNVEPTGEGDSPSLVLVTAFKPFGALGGWLCARLVASGAARPGSPGRSGWLDGGNRAQLVPRGVFA